MIVLTNEGALRLWYQLLGISPIGYPVVHLYSADYTPQHSDTYATFAASELSGGGYSAIELVHPSANWTIAAIAPGAQAAYLTLTWILTAAATIWGYWVSDQYNSYSLWAEQFAAAQSIPPAGAPFLLNLAPWLTSAPSVAGVPCS